MGRNQEMGNDSHELTSINTGLQSYKLPISGGVPLSLNLYISMIYNVRQISLPLSPSLTTPFFPFPFSLHPFFHLIALFCTRFLLIPQNNPNIWCYCIKKRLHKFSKNGKVNGLNRHCHRVTRVEERIKDDISFKKENKLIISDIYCVNNVPCVKLKIHFLLSIQCTLIDSFFYFINNW